MFELIENLNMHKIKIVNTLDHKYFEKEPLFKEVIKEGAKTVNGQKLDPWANPEIIDMCHKHAISSGNGFQPRIYPLHVDIVESLSDEIKDKVEVVDHGDLLSLLAAMKTVCGRPLRRTRCAFASSTGTPAASIRVE